MSSKHSSGGLWTAAILLVSIAACQDAPTTAPAEPQLAVTPAPAQAAFDRISAEVLAVPQTVFAAQDESTGQIVFGVENDGVATSVQAVLRRLGVSASAYRIRVSEPIRFLSTLRTEQGPTVGGIQIHFSNYLCTLGFNAGYSDGYSLFTASHCTDKQGQTGSTAYYQPTSTVNPDPIAIEAEDPAYQKGIPGCSRGKVCRYSDAARALYQSGIAGRGEIARTEGQNNGSVTIDGTFDITSQHDGTSFSGELHKVGRTTGWTSGEVVETCATVNVLGSNIQLLCQTLVSGSGTIVDSGDSGAPVFRVSGGSAELVGLLWGGSSGGGTFVFSPLSGLDMDGFGQFDATTDGVGSGGGGGGGGSDGGDGGDGGGPSCPPNSNSPRCQG